LARALLLIRYDHNDALNAFWLSIANGRIIWGGDETVQHMRTFPTPVRSREIAFPDRYSICAIKPDAILNLDDNALHGFCEQFYNDIYIMDQAACSSPQLLIWMGEGEEVIAAKDKL